MKTKLSYLSLFFLTAFAYAEQTVELKVEGIKQPDLEQNVRIYLSQLKNDDADGSERYQYIVKETVDKALRAKGYYNTQYHFQLTPRKAPAKNLLTLSVQLDKPVKLDERDVVITGQAEQDEDIKKLLAKGIPPAGTILNHETYDNFKGSIEKIAQSKGYFDGEWLYHRLEVYPKEHVADWRLGYQSGERYRYGKIGFTGSQIREDYLENILRIKQGDFYYINDLSKLSSDFSSSNWFASVLVEPEINEEKKEVDLNVLVMPKKKNDVEIGIGYATDVGPRLQLNWIKPWINSRGHSLEMNSYFSKPEQSIELGYKIPVKAHPLNYYYQVSGGIEREDQNDTKFTGAHLGFQRFWNHETGWAFSLGLKSRYDSFEQANDKYKTFLFYPTASMNRTRTDGNRFPLWGDSQKITVNWGTKAILSDVSFYSIKASTAWVRTYFDNHRFVARAEVGYLKASEFERIPPALRYFAGGDMSVRGFGYKDISPKNAEGELVGGSHLATGSLEYQYQVYPSWWGAIFYDTGLASTRFSTKDLHSGVGIGVRWASPIGAIKFDLATPVRSPNNQKGVQFYIGLGTEL
ncbi:outer membrane protein and surface antigen [Actinobacillus indolicus]|nr:outer membrane protein and surface antigen [Actinobacillus indolicus]VTU06738.1 outer membrane protein and surface antigen [Actinobacillus indolicus]